MITLINESSNSAKANEVICKTLSNVFRYVKDIDIRIVCDFPAVGNTFGNYIYMIFINIPYAPGNYYRVIDEKGDNIYLNNIAFALKRLEDDSIESVDDTMLYSDSGSFNYQEEIKDEQASLFKFMKNCMPDCHFKRIPVFYYLKSKNLNSMIWHESLFVNSINMSVLINQACRILHWKGGANFFMNSDFSSSIAKLIESTDNSFDSGVLTKNKMSKISTSTKAIETILSNKGNQMYIISGRAGTGKTLALTRVMYNLINNNNEKNKKHVRLLTYNNLLVYDIKMSLRNFPEFTCTNASIMTLHKFFYRLTKKLGIQMLYTEERCKELYKVCSERIDLAIEIIESSNKIPDWSDLDYFLINNNIKETDKKEITKFIKYLIQKNVKVLNIRTVGNEYLNHRKSEIYTQCGSAIFVEDYNKVLESAYKVLTKTSEFYEERVKGRREYLSDLYQLNKSKNINYTYDESGYVDFIHAAKRMSIWSNLILVDEAQDCNIYEKLILFALKGTDNLVIASGGKDQLIRHAVETDWSVKENGVRINYEKVVLRNVSYRQKANIVDFVNAFYEFFNIKTSLVSAPESKGRGTVILDFSKGQDKRHLFEACSKNGESNGCSNYESVMLLIPETGYTSTISNRKTFEVDESDFFKTNNVVSERGFIEGTLSSYINESDIWNGTAVNKGNLDMPKHNQTRVLFYESCRGLESWTVMCLDVDVFFEHKLNSEDAEDYASEMNNLFSSKEEDKRRFAALWCSMAFTRPMDTLYISFKDEYSYLGTVIKEVAHKLGDKVKILR